MNQLGWQYAGLGVAITASHMLTHWEQLAKRAEGDSDVLAKLDAWCRIGNWLKTGEWL